MNMNRIGFTKVFISCVSVFCFLNGSLQAFPFIPLSLAALGLPIFGSAASSAKGGVKKTLANVDGLVGYAKIFLLVATLIAIIVFLVWAVQAVKRAKRRKKLYGIITLLHRIQADLVLLRGAASSAQVSSAGVSAIPVSADGHEMLSPLVLEELESSKKEAVDRLKIAIKIPFFVKRIGSHAYRRMTQALALIEQNKMNGASQAIFVEQWLKTFDLLWR